MVLFNFYMPPHIMAFDVERYLDLSAKLETDDLDWSQAAAVPLRDEERQFLHYAMNIEDHTLFYLKDLLATPAASDPEVAAFLSCWVYEEHFHGRALERFALAAGEDLRRDPVARLARRTRGQRMVRTIGSKVLGKISPDFAAAHMTWGAMNELTTLTGYQQLARKTENPILRELLERIVKDERRHFAFYYDQAQKRLEASPRQQKITRWMMDRIWRPVGSGEHPVDDIVQASTYLFGDEEGRKALGQIDGQIAKLPGMGGWAGMQAALAMHAVAP